MDRRKIDQNIHDHCLDACVALFMEYYCVALSENIRKELDVIQIEASDFPNELDTRCRTAIKKEYALRKRKKCIQSFAKGLRYVAGVCVVLLALGSVLFMSVEAIRIPIINYYISLNEKYLEIGPSSSINTNSTNEINWNDPLKGLIPPEYTLTKQEKYSPESAVTIYKNANGDRVHFRMSPINNVKRIDSENAETIEQWEYLGRSIILVIKENIITVTWRDEQVGKTFTVIASALEKAEVIDITEKIILLFG